MRNEALRTMFEHSACLSRRQLKDYAAGLVVAEEAHAIETHLNGCPLCSDAVDGLQKAAHSGAAADALHALDDNFLKDHFGWHHPEVHLNTLTPAAHPVSGRNRQRKARTDSFRTSPSLTLFVLLLLGLIWYVQAGRHNFSRSQQLTREASQDAEAQTAAKPVEELTTAVAAEPVITPQPVVAEIQPAAATEQLPPVVPEKTVAPAAVPAAAAPEMAAVKTQAETLPLKATENRALTVTTGEHKPDIKQAVATTPADNMSKAKALYDQQKYATALKLYKQELNSPDKKTRQQAGLMIATIYEKTGQKEKAKASLEAVMEDGGKEKRQAKRMLRDMEANEVAPGLQDEEL